MKTPQLSLRALTRKIIEYPLLFFSDTKCIVDDRTFTTYTTNHASKNTNSCLKKNISPTIYKTFTPRRADTTLSSLPNFPEDVTGMIQYLI